MNTCFEPLNEKLDALLDIAVSWRMNTTGSVPDPAGLTAVEQLDGSVTVDFTPPGTGCTFTATIVFYSPNGIAQNHDLSGATNLSEMIDAAATDMAVLFGDNPNPPPFMVADWTLSGVGLSGSGALTGIIRGNSDPLLNELESVSTTTGNATVLGSGGRPPSADGTVSIDNGNCQLTFSTTDLMTDAVLDQQYPIGTIGFTVIGSATVTGSITFNGSNSATIVVSGVPGDFSLNLDTGDLTYNAP